MNGKMATRVKNEKKSLKLDSFQFQNDLQNYALFLPSSYLKGSNHVRWLKWPPTVNPLLHNTY